MKMTVAQRLEFLRRALPNIDPSNARYMYAKPADMNRKGRAVVVYAVLWSSDARVSLHKTGFNHKPALSVPGWAAELAERAPMVFRDYVIPSINEQTGVSWGVDRILGWHFVKERKTTGRRL